VNRIMGSVISLPIKFKVKEAVDELMKQKRKGYDTFYCSTNVYQTLKQGDPYAQGQEIVSHIMGLRVFVSGTMFDNILIFTKGDIYGRG